MKGSAGKPFHKIWSKIQESLFEDMESGITCSWRAPFCGSARRNGWFQLWKVMDRSLQEGRSVASREHKEENDKEVKKKEPAQQPFNGLFLTKPGSQPRRKG